NEDGISTIDYYLFSWSVSQGRYEFEFSACIVFEYNESIKGVMIRPRQKVNKDGNMRMLTLPNGLQAGITGLDDILEEVASLDLVDPEAIKVELLAKVKIKNFVASGVEKEYAEALLVEYQHKYDGSGKDRRNTQKKTHAG
ncbi:MAG: hypothetical protein JSU79_10090, partial [Dehalococcoidales bacterium]